MVVNDLMQSLSAAQSKATAQEDLQDTSSFLSTVQRHYMQPVPKSDSSEEDFWEQRMKRQKKNMEQVQEEWIKHQMLESQRIRQAMMRPDGEKAEYLAGVPASVLLGMLL